MPQSPLLRVLDALQSHGSTVRRNGVGYMAQCPAHDDRTPSLSIRETRQDGSVLLHCHGGPNCSSESVVGALGMQMSDLYPASESWKYANGHTVYRTADKRFRQSGTPTTTTLLYQDAVAAAVAAGEPVYIAEGEKDADTLRNVLGVTGTTAPGGARAWQKCDYSILTGGKAWIVADNDDAGSERALALADHLGTLHINLLGVLTAPEGVKDISDVAAGVALADMRRETVMEYRTRIIGVDARVSEPERNPAENREERIAAEIERLSIREEAKRRFALAQTPPVDPPRILRLDELLATPDREQEFLINGILPAEGSVLFVAQAKAGKTVFTTNVVRSLVDATPLLGTYDVPEPCTVVSLDYEMAQDDLKSWYRVLNVRNQDRAYVVPMKGSAASLNLFDPQSRSEWAARLAQIGAKVLLVDPLQPIIQAFGLDEWKDVGRVIVHIKMLAAEAGIPVVVIVHHMGWEGERGRGDSSMVGNVDDQWKLRRKNPNDEHSPRLFSAYGRHVDLPEAEVVMDKDTHVLMYRSDLARAERTAAATETADGWLRAVTKYIREHPGMTTNKITKDTSDKGGQKWPQKSISEALRYGVANGFISEVQKGQSKTYFLIGDTPESGTHERNQG